jgi:hypothetical protein
MAYIYCTFGRYLRGSDVCEEFLVRQTLPAGGEVSSALGSFVMSFIL